MSSSVHCPRAVYASSSKVFNLDVWGEEGWSYITVAYRLDPKYTYGLGAPIHLVFKRDYLNVDRQGPRREVFHSVFVWDCNATANVTTEMEK
jgi:hypothetical protein